MSPSDIPEEPGMDESIAQRRGEGDSDEGKGKQGSGKAGGKAGGKSEGSEGSVGTPIVAPLSTEMLKKVMEVWRRIGGDELVQEMTEFFADKLRASANCMVSFTGKAFAVVNWAVEAGKKMVTDFERNRGRAAGAKAPSFRKPANFKPNTPGANGPTGTR